jgi:mRNA-degrading endonuclease RelE of RelBE toxin-antitoxin system
MSYITEVIETDLFAGEVAKVRDGKTLERLRKQIEKIIDAPTIGKPLRYDMRDSRTVYIKPYRLIYSVNGTCLCLMRFEHRKTVYE